MPQVPYADLLNFAHRFLRQLGFAEEDSRYIAEVSALTQAAGVQTHGTVLLTNIETQYERQCIDPRKQPRVVRELAGMALLEAQGSAGPVCMRVACELASRKARQSGIAIVAAANTSWIAGLGAYLLPLARQGFFAQLYAQSNIRTDAAPFGGIDPCFCTNPIALAFPADSETVLADFSTSAISKGKLRTLIKSGKKYLHKAFLTRDGQLTDDPRAVLDGGAMLPAGGDFDGHKGYALALWIEALAAMSGGSCNKTTDPPLQSMTLIVIDPHAFGQVDQMRSEMRQLAQRIHATRPRPGVCRVRLPGERFLAQVKASQSEGVEISEDLLTLLNAAAARRGVEELAEMTDAH